MNFKEKIEEERKIMADKCMDDPIAFAKRKFEEVRAKKIQEAAMGT